MADKKILSIIPENLREDLITEVLELLEDRKQEEQKKKASAEELAAIVDNIM